MIRLALAILLSTATAACGSAGGTLVRDDGVHNALYPYRIGYADPARGHFVSEEWVVENYQTDASGRPTALKSGAMYRASVLVDVTGNGQPDNLGQVPRYDLRLEHRLTSAHLYARALPLEHALIEAPLDALATRLLPRLAHGLAQDARPPAGPPSAAAVPPSGRIVSQRSRTLAGAPALDLVIEGLAATSDDAAPRTILKSRYLLMRAPFRHPVKQVGRDTVLLPVVVLLAYSAAPDEYDLGAPDFERFIARFDLLDDAGVLRRERARLMRCDPQRDAMTLKVEVDREGHGALLETDARPEKKSCQAVLVGELRFAATGEGRVFEATLGQQP